MTAPKHIYLALAAILSLLAAGCGQKKQAPARLTPLPEDAVVLIYAAGVGEEADFFRSAPMDDVLRETFKRKVVSAGQAGEYAESALARLPAVLEQCKPGLVILAYGAMDLWKKTDRAKFKATLGSMVDTSRQSGAQVVMLALPDLSKLRLNPDPLFAEVAGEKGVPIETEVISSTLRKPSQRVFRYMVNDDGLAKIAEAVKALCVRSGGLPPSQ